MALSVIRLSEAVVTSPTMAEGEGDLWGVSRHPLPVQGFRGSIAKTIEMEDGKCC